MLNCNVLRIVPAALFILPDKLCNKIGISKNFVTHIFEIAHFRIIYGNKNSTIIRQKISRHQQS